MFIGANSNSQTPTASRYLLAVTGAVLLCGCFVSSFAQSAGSRSARSLTSEDLLNRPARFIAPTIETSRVVTGETSRIATGETSHVTSSAAVRASGSSSYRDPSGAFTLNFPNTGWRVNARGGSAGRAYNQRSFRRIDAEGFASATANVYVLSDRDSSGTLASMSADEQRGLAGSLASRFLSSNASLVSVEPGSRGSHAGLRIVADQFIARRVAVRAVINVFERQGRLYVVVCCSSPETFDASQYEFDAISNSLASSVVRS